MSLIVVSTATLLHNHRDEMKLAHLDYDEWILSFHKYLNQLCLNIHELDENYILGSFVIYFHLKETLISSLLRHCLAKSAGS
jgi:hypothetical protein